MLLKESTLKAQEALASYCRTNVLPNIEGLTPGRVHHYRRLISNIILDALSNAYPITHTFLGDEIWIKLVDEFFEKYKCTEPQVWRMPKDFYHFIQNEEKVLTHQYAFLEELVYFEWLELEVYMMEDIPILVNHETGDFLKDEIVLNPESKIVAFTYPVHKTHTSELKSAVKGQYYCLIYREPQNFKVKFIDLSQYFAFLIEQLYKDVKLQEIIEAAALQMQMDTKILLNNTLPFLNYLKKEQFILGFK